MTNFPDSILPHLGLHLTNAGLLDQNSIYEIAEQAKSREIPFITQLTQANIITSQQILNACETIFSLPVFDLTNHTISTSTLLNPKLIRQYRVIPLLINNNILHIGMSDPTDQQAIEAITFHTKLNIKIFLVDENLLAALIDTLYDDNQLNNDLQNNLLQQIIIDEKEEAFSEKMLSMDEPLIQFVDNIIIHAFQQNVSDIHIEACETICRIRYRQHGILLTINEIPQQLATRIMTRLKVMAKLNIAEKRLPQDGRFQLDHIDIRMNTCPTLFGEKVVLRLLNSNQITLSIYQLGLNKQQQTIFIDAISRSQGMILVTGPTGSGKTVTLYSALAYLNNSEKNISTVEDPVEIRLNGINQVNINYKIGLDFSTVLRAFLRQDPDIIMIGEIRDRETANIAIQASQTGHLVLSTFHTNSAVETITRMRAIGIPSWSIAESVSLIVAQRLLRRLCNECKIPEEISLFADLQTVEPIDTEYIYRANGCSKCIKGYQDRIAIYECLPISDHIHQLIHAETNSHHFLTQAKQQGFSTLREQAIEYVINGTTSLAEINRVLQA